ncbi:hypothetical protein GCM10020295_46880 [Streptomyces cinereospinus]
MAKWTPKHEAPEPLEGPVVGTITGGTIVWFALFLAQLPFYGWFDEHGHTWWLWTCLAGRRSGPAGHLVRPPPRRRPAPRRATRGRTTPTP